MQRLEYALLDPTGNLTLLVETPCAPALQAAAAAALMAAEPAAEQVGFLSPDPACAVALRMAGGEFCGNAAMSAAVLTALARGLDADRLSVRVSGAAEPVAVDVRALPGGAYRGEVAMPRPRAAEYVSLSGRRCPAVFFDGIVHLILEEAPDRPAAERLAPRWCRDLDADALGLMFLDRAAGTMTPLVYVPAADTLCWENSCASGTTAAAAWLSRATGPARFSLRQPGGVLEAAVSPEGDIALAGQVSLRKRDARTIDL